MKWYAHLAGLKKVYLELYSRSPINSVLALFGLDKHSFGRCWLLHIIKRTLHKLSFQIKFNKQAMASLYLILSDQVYLDSFYHMTFKIGFYECSYCYIMYG